MTPHEGTIDLKKQVWLSKLGRRE
ncbi:unnamed protein product [Cuscuta epithymum]|uniref:Uncharacterized protein n=1 Tax=Cuscuta epithymum TaxID=186058 RepID=A0AAV0CPJ0_9ASTE|nr:unnamed protein product [Cuscuta epithymum]